MSQSGHAHKREGVCRTVTRTKRINRRPAKARSRSPRSGEDNKLNKRAEVLQAGSAEQNIGTEEEETAARGERMEERGNPKRTKAGR
ncbi:MAG: hypothetical protein M3R15_17145 [Acidobacteriota bacterium]|nr:hypothetical protein [Acidobacteriota bacterium]